MSSLVKRAGLLRTGFSQIRLATARQASIRCVHSQPETQATATATATPTTHFGFQTVPAQQKQHMVADVFHRVANNYDLMNDLMSAGVHRVWKDFFMAKLRPTPGMALLDVAGGTGDIAFRFVESVKSTSPFPALSSPQSSTLSPVVVCDINASMLRVGQERARQLGYINSDVPLYDPSGIAAAATASPDAPPFQKTVLPTQALLTQPMNFVVGDAQELPFEDNSFDAYTIAFGLRNVTDIDKALREARRVLKKGGRFLCLEFSQLNNPLLQAAYDAYSFNVIPMIGQMVVNDRASYQYLVESIRRFPEQNLLCDMMREAGFKGVGYTDYTFGVCAVHSGYKL